MPRRLETLFYELRAKTEGLSADLNGAEKQYGKLAKFISDNPTASALALGGAVAGVAVTAVSSALEVETAAHRIDRALGLTADQAVQMREQIRGFSVEFGRSQTEIAAVMQTVADNGPGSAAGLQVMTRAALELSQVTGGDANSIAAGLDGVIDGFGRTSEEAEQVAANLYAITKGRVPLQDLFDTLDKVAAKAHASGLSLEDVVGAATALRDANVPMKQVKQDLEDLANAGDLGAARIRELAGGVRDAANDMRDFGAAVKDAASQADELAKKARAELNGALIDLASLALPAVLDRLHDVNSLLGAIENHDFAKIGRGIGIALGQSLPGGGGARTGEAFGAIGGAIGGLFGSAPQKTGLETDPGLVKALTGASGAGAGGGGNDVVAKRVKAITAATADIESVAKPRVRAFIAELTALGKTSVTGQLGVDITTLTKKLQDELPKAGTKIEAVAKKATDDLAAFVQQAAAITARAAGDQIAAIDQQIAKLTADATKAKALGTPDYTRAKAALEQQRADTIVAQQEAERVQQDAQQVQQQIELSSALADAKLGRVRAGITEIQTSAEVLAGGLVNLSQDQIDSLLGYQDTLKSVIADEQTGNDERERAKTVLTEVQGLLHGVEPTVAAVTKHTHEWVGHLVQGARALVEALQVAGTLDQKMASIVSSAITFGESLGAAIKSKGADVGADIAAVASLINIGKGLFGKSDADVAHERALDANTKAIADLAKHAGDLANLSVSGSTFGLARNVVGAIVAGLAQGGKYGAPIANGTKVRNVGDILDASGLSADDLTAIAKTLGVTIDGTAGSYRKLAQALSAADYKAFADSWSGILADMETINEIDGVTNPVDILKSYLGALGKSGSSVLGSILAANFDVDSADGRAGLRAAARSWLDQFRQGLIDPSTLGNLTPQEFLDALKTLIGDVDAVGVAADGAATGVDALSASLDTLNASLSDIALLGDLLGHSAEDIYQSLDKLVQAFPQFGTAIAGLVRGVDFTTADGRQRFKDNVANLATQFAEGGLTDAERALLQQLLSLEHSADALATAATTATDGVDALAGGVQQLGETVEQITQRLLDAASQAATDARRLGRDGNQAEADYFTQNVPGLGPITTSDAQSVAAGLDALRKKYASGDANDVANHEFYGGAIDFLLGLQSPAAPTGGSANGPDTVAHSEASLSETTGSTLADLDRTLVLLARESIDEERRQTALLQQLLTPVTTPPLQAPPFAAYAQRMFGGGGASSAPPMNVDITVNLINPTIGDGGLSGPGTFSLATDLERYLAILVQSPESPLRQAIATALGSEYTLRALVQGGGT